MPIVNASKSFLHSVSVAILLVVGTQVSLVISQSCSRGTVRTSDGSCQPCSPGSYSDSENAQVCKPCSAGRFLNVHGAQTQAACRVCPGGTFSKEGASECTACSPGFDSPKRSSRCVQCPPGTRISSSLDFRTQDCTPCNGGYSSLPNQLVCHPCPPGRVAPPGATSINQCLRCPPGTAPGYGRCEPCGEGSFGADGLSCRPCPIGTRSVGPTNTRCEACSPGFFGGTLLHGYECIPCSNGTTTFGTVSVLCRREGSPCPNTYLENAAGDCVWCPVDSFYDRELQSCEPCRGGFGSAGGLVSQCLPCSDILSTNITDSLCFRSDRATSPNENGNCPPGTHISVDVGRTCRSCHPGSFSGRINSIGVFNRILETVSCTPCPPGTVQPRPGASTCQPCPPGTEPDEYLQKCLVPQSNCELGSSLVELFPQFELCLSDTCDQIVGFEEFEGRRCGTCDVGQFAPEPSVCSGCPANSVGDGLRCASCPDGLVRYNDQCGCRGIIAQNRGIIDGSCQLCPPGSYGDLNESGTENVCRKCSAGTFRSVTDDDIISGCIGFGRCFPGPPCLKCPPNSFTDTDGALECKPCPPGTFTYGVGETECLVLGAASQLKQLDGLL